MLAIDFIDVIEYRFGPDDLVRDINFQEESRFIMIETGEVSMEYPEICVRDSR
jgi:hypothetical protein